MRNPETVLTFRRNLQDLSEEHAYVNLFVDISYALRNLSDEHSTYWRNIVAKHNQDVVLNFSNLEYFVTYWSDN